MSIDNPTGTDDNAPMSLEDAAAAYANLNEADEPDTGQSEAENETQGEADQPEDDLELDGENEDEGQAEDEADEPAAPAYVADDAKVKLADGTETTVAELKNGTLRLQDYRRKTEEVAAERKAVTEKSEQIAQFEQQMAADRDFTIHLLQSIMPQKPDPSMYSVDPFGYGEQKAQYEARKEQLDYLVYQAQQTDQRRQAEQQESAKATSEREWQRTLEALPELADVNRLKAFVGEIQEHGQHYGYSLEDLKMVGNDHRQAVVLKDAIAWRKLQASKSKVAAKVEGRPPVQRGGNRPTAEGQRTRDARVAMDRLKSSGTLRDGVAALLALEKG